MSIELQPLGVTCNLSCAMCYQEPMRDAGNIRGQYDMEAMKRGLEAEGWKFTLFGGEPLLMPIADLEEIFRWGKEKWGSSRIQTNGTLITDEHIRIFREHNVQVGISCEGPEELNDSRWAGSIEKTREATRKTQEAILRLCREGMAPSVIVTLHRGNARQSVRPRLKAWLKEIADAGVQHVRLHLLEVDDPEVGAALQFTPAENIACVLDFARWEPESGLKFDLTRDLEVLLTAADEGATCTWNACDPYTTRAVRGVSGDGQRSNCGRTNKDGVNWRKADREGFERYMALYQTPQEFGGCQGCRFWLACKGQCPGTAIDQDWRNRTADCETWMALSELVEQRLVAQGKTPVSLRGDRREIEAAMVEGWERGENLTVAQAVARVEGGGSRSNGSNGHSDSGHPRGDQPHVDTPHIDTPHVDWGG